MSHQDFNYFKTNFEKLCANFNNNSVALQGISVSALSLFSSLLHSSDLSNNVFL